jgi:hypothetical protein
MDVLHGHVFYNDCHVGFSINKLKFDRGASTEHAENVPI